MMTNCQESARKNLFFQKASRIKQQQQKTGKKRKYDSKDENLSSQKDGPDKQKFKKNHD